MSDPFVAVVTGAAELKRGNPAGYELFLRSVQALAEHHIGALLATSGTEHILQAQGKAQVLAELHSKLEDCTALDLKYRRGP